jgi:hypothetical protein
MQQSDKDRIFAGIGTALAVLVLLLWIMLSEFRINIADIEGRTWPPVDSSEIVFGGEFVKLGDIPLPVDQQAEPMPQESAEEPTYEGTDLADAGEKAEVAPTPVASEKPSPMKVEKKAETPEKKGPTKEELAEQERIKRQKEQEAQSKKISSGMKNSFSNSSKASSGTSGSSNGNSNSGALAGTPGYSLKGRTAESWGATRSTLAGSITIRVSVNRQGYVVGTPSYVAGTGPAAANSQVRQSCINAARSSRFSVDLDAPAEQVGTITWTFK